MLTPEQIAANTAAWGEFISANAPPSPLASYEEWVAFNDWLRAHFVPPFPEDAL